MSGAVSRVTVAARIRRGWPDERIFSTGDGRIDRYSRLRTDIATTT